MTTLRGVGEKQAQRTITIPDRVISPEKVIEESVYLANCPDWTTYIGEDKIEAYSPNFVARNNMIWELIAGERTYLVMLNTMRTFYLERFPVTPSGKHEISASSMADRKMLHQALLCGVSELTREHARILQGLLALHKEDESYKVKHLGACLLRLLNDEALKTLIKLYGECTITESRLREFIKRCERQPSISNFFEKVKSEPGLSRRNPHDCAMVVVQRWTKVRVLMESIQAKTLDQPEEAEDLEQVLQRVDQLLKGSERVMIEFRHAAKLRELPALIRVPEMATDKEIAVHQQLQAELACQSTRLLNFDGLSVFPSGVAQEQSVKVTGVALNTCFFLLKKVPDTSNYTLYKAGSLPMVIWWTKNQCYFRRVYDKVSVRFHIISNSETALVLFQCNTTDELTRWERVLIDGFSEYRGEDYVDPTAWNDLERRQHEISQKWENTVKMLDILSHFDKELLSIYNVRGITCSVAIQGRLCLAQSIKELKRCQSNALKPTDKQNYSSLRLQKHSLGASVDHGNRASSNVSEELSTFIPEKLPQHKMNSLVHLFNEYLKHIVRALLSETNSEVTRSSSDIQERKFDRKTFGASDTEAVKWERKFMTKKTVNPEEVSTSRDLPDDLFKKISRMSEQLEDKEKLEQVLSYLDLLYQVSQELCGVVCETQAKNIELAARVDHLTSSLESAQSAIAQFQKGGGLLPPSDEVLPSFTVTQAIEKVHQQTVNFRLQYAEWETKRKRQESAIEQKYEKLAKAKQKLKEDQAELAKDRARYEEDCLTLQQQINLHSLNNNGSLGNLSLPGLTIAESPSISGLQTLTNRFQDPVNRVSSFHLENERSSDSEWGRATPSSIHNRERDERPMSSIPDHIGGSLLNQLPGSGRQDNRTSTDLSFMPAGISDIPHKQKRSHPFRKS